MTVGFTTHPLAIRLISSALFLVVVSNIAKTQCPGLGAITFNVVAAPEPTLAFPTSICDGQSATIAVNEPFNSYLWSTGSTSNSITVTQGGSYTVTVTNLAGCDAGASASVAVNTNPQPTITGPTTICQSSPIVLSAAGGFADWAWSNGGSTPSITVSTGGNYAVTATDAIGCTAVAAISINVSNLPTPAILGSSTICNGASTLLTLSQSYTDVLWSTGETTQQITAPTAGTYSLTVSDLAGCTGATSVTVTTSSSLSPQIALSPITCGLVGLDAGPGFASYAWPDGSNAQTTAVSQNGEFTVTVSDAGGCTGTATITVTLPIPVQVAISGGQSICTGGSSTLTATGGFQDYIWSNGAIGTEITVAQAGDYAVTVSDINGCTGTAQVMVTVGSGTPPQIVGSNVICVGGSAVLSLANAANFTQFLWSNGSTAPQITATVAGVYAVTTTDGSGCTATASIAVTEGNALAPTISESGYNCDGNLTLEAPDGYAGYVWSTGSGTPIITVSQDGSYSLTVTDASGCTGTASISVQVPDELVVVVQTPPTPICPGSSAQLSVPPGFNSYAWNTGETSNSILIGSPGNYAVTVSDQYGCTAFDEYAFNFAQAPDFGIIGDQLDCESAEAVLEIDLVDVIGSPSFLWSNGATTATLVTAQPGVFSITVSDGNGCTATQSTEVLPQESFFSSFADTIEFVPGQVVSLVPPSLDFQPVGIAWSPTDILVGCDNCPTAQARPIEDELVTYTAVSEAGCTQEGTFFLFFKDRIRPSVYAPNAFSPDSPYNPAFTLFGNELVVEIKYLRIFTRWGEMIVELKNLALNDPSKGWDGSFRGELVDPGVFVWAAEVVYENGTTEVLKRDLTVVRQSFKQPTA